MKDWLNYRISEDLFIRINQNKYSFKDINNTVHDRVLSLFDFGVKKEDRVALFLSNSLDFIETYLACYKLQSSSIILNPQWKKNELKKALETVPADFIICNYKDKSLFAGFGKPIIFFEELSKSFGSCYSDDMNENLDGDIVQSILFTSGTQGFPKPVCLTYNNFYQSSMKWKKAIDLYKEDSYLLSLPLHHIAGLAILVRALHIGFSINIDNTFSDISNTTVLSAVPTLLIQLIKKEEHIKNLKKIRCIILSGAEVSDSLLDECEKHNLNIFLSYGLTETCSSICGFWPFKEDLNFRKTVGKPFDGVDIKIASERIVIKSNTIMKKYFNGDFTNGEFITNDKGIIKNNYLTLTGRTDNIVISGAENIDQVEVVEAISSIIESDKIIPFKKTDPYWGEVNGVYVYTNQKIKPSDIKSQLEKLISKYKIPKEIIIKEIKS